MRSGGRNGGRGLEKYDLGGCMLARRGSVCLVTLFLSLCLTNGEEFCMQLRRSAAPSLFSFAGLTEASTVTPDRI